MDNTGIVDTKMVLGESNFKKKLLNKRANDSNKSCIKVEKAYFGNFDGGCSSGGFGERERDGGCGG